MHKISLYLFLLLFSLANAQKTQPEFMNQGEAEDYSAKELFQKEYVKQHFEKFKGKISVIDKNTIKFDNKTLVIWAMKPELLQVFIIGLFYPQIVIGNGENVATKTKSELDSLTDDERLLYKMSKNDTLKISDFEEVKFLSKSQKVKRFRFWHYLPDFTNPQVCFIELTNKKATAKTNIETFIKEAELTFFKEGWLIL